MIDAAGKTLIQLAAALSAGQTTARDLVEQSIARIADPAHEGARCFIYVDTEAARQAADMQDAARKAGQHLSPWAGIPFSAKDLFDQAGQVTTAGSALLKGAAPARYDAVAIARLKAAGMINLGRTNMTEFAYSGVGLNPHYGTPRAIFDRATGRIPGGSSSGAGVAVADGMCALSIGTDTGGSCRIPACYNGIVGFKPSVGRVSTVGVYPLSQTFDSVGPLAHSVSCCAVADSLMAGDWNGEVSIIPAEKLRFGVLTTHAMANLDPEVAADFARAIVLLRKSNAHIDNAEFPELLELPNLMVHGGIVAAETFAFHKAQIAKHESAYDPRVVNRIKPAANISATMLAHYFVRRDALIERFNQLAAPFDALIMPTTPNVSPAIAALADVDAYNRFNGLSLRNTYLGNFLNGCSISIPMHLSGAPPTGFMMMAAHGQDQALFQAAAAVERILP